MDIATFDKVTWEDFRDTLALKPKTYQLWFGKQGSDRPLRTGGNVKKMGKISKLKMPKLRNTERGCHPPQQMHQQGSNTHAHQMHQQDQRMDDRKPHLPRTNQVGSAISVQARNIQICRPRWHVKNNAALGFALVVCLLAYWRDFVSTTWNNLNPRTSPAHEETGQRLHTLPYLETDITAIRINCWKFHAALTCKPTQDGGCISNIEPFDRIQHLGTMVHTHILHW